MELIDKLNQTIKLLDEIEAYGNELVNRLTDVNYRISDIEHKIENEKLKTNQCYRVVQRLHDLRIERRKIKNDIELINCYRDNQNKLLHIDNRKILASKINNTYKSLTTSVYKNRVYTEEEMAEILGE